MQDQFQLLHLGILRRATMKIKFLDFAPKFSFVRANHLKIISKLRSFFLTLEFGLKNGHGRPMNEDECGKRYACSHFNDDSSTTTTKPTFLSGLPLRQKKRDKSLKN